MVAAAVAAADPPLRLPVELEEYDLASGFIAVPGL